MIKNNISQILGSRRMSIKELAETAGISYPTAHGLYSDKNKRLDVEVLNKICAALDVQVGDLFTYIED